MKAYHYILIGAGAILLWNYAQESKAAAGALPPPKGAGIFGPVDDFLNWAFPGMLKRDRTIATFGEQPTASPPFPD